MNTTTKQTAAALRSALRLGWPTTKWSVRMARGTAYGWLEVSWTDGPADTTIRRFVREYESSRFDGMDDSYHSTGNQVWNCCGINTQRRVSPEFLAVGMSHVEHDTNGVPFARVPNGTVCDDVWCEDESVAQQWCYRNDAPAVVSA